MSEAVDEFEERARAVLRDDPKLLAALMGLRADVQRFVAQSWPGSGKPSAEAINARNHQLFVEAARLLGAQRFEAVFGFPAEQRIDLVDPRIAEDGAAAPPPAATRFA